MKRYLLAAVAASAIVAGPAAARDNQPYVGLEGGVLFPNSQDGDFDATFTQSAQTPVAGSVAPLPGTGFVGALPAPLATAPAAITGPGRIKWKTGFDVDAIAGYDLGMFKIEGELGYKRAKMKNFNADTAFGASVAAALNPVGTTGTAFVFPNASDIDFGINDHVSVWSAMLNGLLDLGGNGGIGGYVGGGIGRAWVKELGESDSAWAYQGIAGVTFPISSNLDIGLKYRYFRTGHLNFDTAGAALVGSTRTAVVPNTGVGATGSTNVTFTRTALVTGAFDDHFSSHSLLASLIYSFGAPPAPPPPLPAPVVAPPPPPAPATQVCPDGTTILATDTCPAPPPPPPPPPPAPERG